MQKFLFLFLFCLVHPLSYGNQLDKVSVIVPIPKEFFTINSIEPLPKYQNLSNLYHLGKHQQAIEEALEYLKETPNDGDVRFVLAQFYAQSNLPSLARQQLIKLLQEYPRYLEARLLLIKLDLAAHDVNQVKELILSGLALDPENPDLLEIQKNVTIEKSEPIRSPEVGMQKNITTAVSNPQENRIKMPPQSPVYIILKKMMFERKYNDIIKKAVHYLQTHSDDGDVQYIVGQAFAQQKQYDLAVEQFHKVLVKTPKYTDARVALIHLYIQLREFAKAQKTVSDGLRIQPNQPDLLSAQGSIYLAQGNLSQARGLANQALLLKPDNDNANVLKKSLDEIIDRQTIENKKNNLVDYLTLKKMYSERKYKEIMELIIPYLKKYPDDGDVRYILGQVYEQQKQYVQALEQYHKVLVKTPKYTEVRLALTRLYVQLKELDKAQETMSNGLMLQHKEQKNEVEIVEYTLLKRLYSERKYREIAELAIPYLKNHPDDGDIRYILGQVFIQQKQYPLALEQFHQALIKTPKYTDVRVALIHLYIQLKELDKAQKTVNEGTKLQPNNPDLLSAQGSIYLAQGQLSKAHFLVSQALIAQSNNENALELKKKLDLISNQKKKVNNKKIGEEYKILQKMYAAKRYVEIIQRAVPYLKMHPDDGDVRYILGQTYVQMKQYDLAYEQFYCGLAKTPKYTEMRVALINLDIQLKQFDLAQEAVSDGLALQPNNYNLLSSQGTVLFEQGRFPPAAIFAHQSLAVKPMNKAALFLKKNLDQISNRYMIGRETIGLLGQGLYVSDVHQIWQYGTVYYQHDTDYGPILGKMNYSERFGFKGYQGEIEAFPILTKDLYFDIDLGYANQPIIFPNYMIGLETYFSIPKFLELSCGGKYNKITSTKAYTYYTGSARKQIKNDVFFFRPIYYTTQPGDPSLLYTGYYRHYFQGDTDFYINVFLVEGNSPDLNDLLAANFITIHNSGLVLDLSFPVCNHTLVIDIGATYIQQDYPTFVRNLVGASLSFKKRF